MRPFGDLGHYLPESPVRKYLLNGSGDQSLFEKLHEALLFGLSPLLNAQFGIPEIIMAPADGFHQFTDAVALRRDGSHDRWIPHIGAMRERQDGLNGALHFLDAGPVGFIDDEDIADLH